MILIAIIVIALAVGVVISSRDKNQLHDFDNRATLPVRGFAAIMIVFYHVSLNVPESQFLNLFNGTGPLMVSIFFFMSGYGLMLSYINKGEHYLHGFLGHRFARLLPPFLIAAIGYEIYKSTFPNHSTLDSLMSIVHGGTVLPDSWFIITIIVYYLLFYVVARLLRNPVRIVIGLWMTSFAYIALLYYLGWGSYWYNTVCVFNFGTTYVLLENKIKKLENSITSFKKWQRKVVERNYEFWIHNAKEIIGEGVDRQECRELLRFFKAYEAYNGTINSLLRDKEKMGENADKLKARYGIQ